MVGVILAINKREVGSEHDIFFENYYTEVRGTHLLAFLLSYSCNVHLHSTQLACDPKRRRLRLEHVPRPPINGWLT